MDVSAITTPPQVRLRRLRRGAALNLGRFHLVRSRVFGQPVTFCVADRNDLIQRHHMKGHFYEMPELEMIRQAFKPGGVFFDFGANVGNHALFVAKFLHPSRVVVVEPNRMAYETLIANIAVNGLDDVLDFRWLGYGVSDSEASGLDVLAPIKNLGAGKVIDGGGDGEVVLVPGDRVVGDTVAGFIKIDTEGMEMAVLAGLAQTIARDKPNMFVEVSNPERDAFLAWVADNGYGVEKTFRRYEGSENFLLIHKDAPKAFGEGEPPDV